MYCGNVLVKADSREVALVLLAGRVGWILKLWKALVLGLKGWKGGIVLSDTKTEVLFVVWVVLTTCGFARRAGVLLSSLFEAMLNVCQLINLLNTFAGAKGASYRYIGVEIGWPSSCSQIRGCLAAAEDDGFDRVGSETYHILIYPRS